MGRPCPGCLLAAQLSWQCMHFPRCPHAGARQLLKRYPLHKCGHEEHCSAADCLLAQLGATRGEGTWAGLAPRPMQAPFCCWPRPNNRSPANRSLPLSWPVG